MTCAEDSQGAARTRAVLAEARTRAVLAEARTRAVLAEARTRAVLDVVDAIPPGRVMTYGDIARYLAIPSARQVGQIMARAGHEVPWHRVVMADGSPATPHPAEHLARLRAERTPLRGDRVDLSAARWRPG